jgi:competence transcription factor ComK
MAKKTNYTVKICEDYVVRDPDKVKEILERVSKIISNSYIREKRVTK